MVCSGRFNKKKRGIVFSQGFSLVEVLAVIAIIGILVGIGFFLISSIKANERDNQRGIDTARIQDALQNYLVDHGDFSAILSADGAAATLDPDGAGPQPNQSFVQAYYYSTPIHPTGPGRNELSALQTHLAPYLPTMPQDPNNKFAQWLADGKPDYNHPSLVDGYIWVGIASINVISPACPGKLTKVGFFVETVLENENDSSTNFNRRPDLFSCIPSGNPQRHVMTMWGTY